MADTISLIGMIIAFALLIFMMMKGVKLFLAVMIVVTIAVVTAGMNPYETFLETYMSGFVGYYKSYFFLFLAGALLGKIMEISGAATSIAKFFISIAKGNAWLSIPLASALLAYGGVNAFTTIFATYPVALEIFKQEDISRRLLPGTLYFGACTFAMVGPGAPQIQNITPATGLGQPLTCGLVSGIVGCGAMAVIGCIWLRAMIKKSKAAGEHFDELKGDTGSSFDSLPHPALSLLPLVTTLIAINISIDGVSIFPVEVALLMGSVLAIICLHKYIHFKEIPQYIMDSVTNTSTLIFNTSTMVGFGAVVQMTSGFQKMVDAVVNIPGPYLIGAAVGATLICGLCGSASGGLGIATPIFVRYIPVCLV